MKILLKFALLYVVCIGIFTPNLCAQTASFDNYTFSTNTSSSLVDMSGSTQLIGAGQNFANSGIIDIGFDIWYMGKHYSQFSCNANGVIRFGSEVVLKGGNTYMISGNARLCVLSSGTNLDGEDSDIEAITGSMATAPTIGKVHYKMVGTEPNRALVVEWKNMKINHNSTSTSYATFQCVFYETSPDAGNTVGGNIEFIYGEVNTNARNNAGQTQSIDVRAGIGEGGDDGKGINIGSATASTITDGVAIVTSLGKNATTISSLHSTADGSRRMFAFTPPASTTGTASALNLKCATASAISMEWTEPSTTNAVGAVIYRSTDGTNYEYLDQVALGVASYVDRTVAASTTYYYRLYLVSEGRLSSLGGTASGSATTQASTTSVYAVNHGNWSDTETWSTEVVPTTSNDVVICGFDVTVTGSGNTCANLTVESGASLTLDIASSLDINGDVVNDGTFDLGSNEDVAVSIAGSITNNGSWKAGLAAVTLDGTSQQVLSNTGTATYSETTTITATETITYSGTQTTTFDNFTTLFGVSTSTVGIVQDINVIIDADHNDLGDLIIRLISPEGTSQIIANFDDGCGGRSMNVVLDDEATDGGIDARCSGGTSADGTFTPTNPLSNFDGEYMIGEWQLSIRDFVFSSSNNGTLNTFSLEISYANLAPAASYTITGLAFYDLIVNNTSTGGVYASNTSIYIANSATLTDGVVAMASSYETIFIDGATSNIGSNASHIDGKVRKIGNEAFDFPLGNDAYSANLGISAPSATTDEFTAIYYHSSPNGSWSVSSKDVNIEKVSTAEYWLLERTAGSSAVSVSLSYEDTRSGGVTDPAALRVCHWTGVTWADEGYGGAASNFTGIVSNGTINSFSPFTLGSIDGSNPLPITLINFQVFTQEEEVLLEWKASNAVGFSHFEVERGLEGQNFQPIQTVPYRPQETSLQQYQIYDHEARWIADSPIYYRLKMVDNDGNYAYSPVRKAIMTKGNESPFMVTGNPFSHSLGIQTSGKTHGIVHLSLIDMAGKIVAQETVDAQDLEKWQWRGLSSLSKGNYLLHIRSPKEDFYLKVQKQ